MNYSFVSTCLSESFWQPDFLLLSMPFHCHPYLYTSWSVFPLFLSLFLGVRSLSSSTFYPYSRRAGISSRVVALTGVSRALDLTEPPQPPSLSSIYLNYFASLPSLMTLTHLWMQCNSWSLKSLRFMKIQRYSLLVTLMTYLREK